MVLYDLHDCTFTGFLLKNMNFVINNEKKVNYSWNPEHCRTTCKVSDTWVSRKIQDFWNLCQWGQRFIVKRLGLNAIGTLFDPNDWIHVWALHSSFPARMNKRNWILLSCDFGNFVKSNMENTVPPRWNHKSKRGKPFESFLFKTDLIGVREIQGTFEDFHLSGHDWNYACQTNWKW